MKSNTSRPIVLIPSCQQMLGEHPHHVVGWKYVEAVRLAGCTPLVVPVAQEAELDTLVALADGVLLTGSKSNVHPSHFGEEVLDPSLPLDPARDAWTLPLVRRIVDQGMPLLAICRGMQEVNVALGGSLHQAVQDVGPFADHRAPDGLAASQQFATAHTVQVAPGGLLADIVQREVIEVNSLHGQGVRDLAGGLCVEARAPDGLVEACSITASPSFALCVQWHPEWQAADNPVSMQLLQAFGLACRARHESKVGSAAR